MASIISRPDYERLTPDEEKLVAIAKRKVEARLEKMVGLLREDFRPQGLGLPAAMPFEALYRTVQQLAAELEREASRAGFDLQRR